MITGLLITGTSHVGKSTLARNLGSALNWAVKSTDDMARHPGRPWPDPPAHVIEHYRQHSSDQVCQSLLNHHLKMWPSIRQLVENHLAKGSPFIIEGSALRPEFIKQIDVSRVVAVCLHCSEDVLRERIYTECNYQNLDEDRRYLVDRFLHRSAIENGRLFRGAQKLNLRCIDTEDAQALSGFTQNFLAEINSSNSN